MSRELPILAVVYDDGAASPGDIAVGLADLARPVFLTADTPHVTRLRPVMESLGDCLPLTGSPEGDAALIRGLAPAAVVTYSERMLRTTADLARAAGLPFHTPETARILTDKVRQRELLREAGVDDVRTHPLRTPEDWPAALAAVGLPAIIKPVRGAASRNTHQVSDEAEALRLLPEIFAAMGGPAGDEPLLIVEELLQGRPLRPFGDYVSVESMCGPHGIAHLALSGKFPLLPPFREAGRFWPSQLPAAEQEEILELTTRALKALGVELGLTHTELKLTADGPRIIEVNGRLGGHVNGLSRTACGVDLVRVAALLALGRPVEPVRLRPDKVHFQYHGLAPTEPCRLAAIEGTPQVRQLPGVDGYRNFVRVGDDLPGGVLTHEMDVIWGQCDDHTTMIELLDTALTTLTYTFDTGGTPHRTTAAALRDDA
ncbi:acetyl-CoA carboxylase biotin carboxylase subunit family protein [Kitasatospora sp. NPDC051984]|uniref:acetyl-CoA carboxylase biotin carboxylase subunit family protein n=1 Tax=Kitasatospora sp. NPDC051984 TaxID=3364059 RepID=UPI0037C631BE